MATEDLQKYSTMRLLLLVALTNLPFPCNADYVPGTPGASWTNEELTYVSLKLSWVTDNPQRALEELTRTSDQNWAYIFKTYLKDELNGKKNLDSILPNYAKFVRLSFHDCLVEKNTGKGCNGCINFENMGRIFGKNGVTDCKKPKPNNSGSNFQFETCSKPQTTPTTDNNNLLWAALVLEEIYRNPNYGPSVCGQSSKSLFQLGKSRADLWALAGIVAVRDTVMNHNKKCNYMEKKPPPCLNEIHDNSKDCTLQLGVPTFKTGRADCVSNCLSNFPPFCTKEEEIHPDPHGNGLTTAQFFNSSFNLNVQEAVAVLGAHNLGRTHSSTSLFADAPWTPQGQDDWNNLYYINGVNSTGFRFANPSKLLSKSVHDCGLDISAYTGDAHGYMIPLAFRIRNEKQFQTTNQDGGPHNWQLFGTPCNVRDCEAIKQAGKSYSRNSCCHWVNTCKNTPSECPFPSNFLCYNNLNCDRSWVFMDVNMLNVDMGFVFDFQTRSDGLPLGCKGMGTLITVPGNEGAYSEEVKCPTNDRLSGLPLPPYLIGKAPERTFFAEFDFYAKNAQNWVKTFTQAYDKLLQNRVDSSKLTEAPMDWFEDTTVEE